MSGIFLDTHARSASATPRHEVSPSPPWEAHPHHSPINDPRSPGRDGWHPTTRHVNACLEEGQRCSQLSSGWLQQPVSAAFARLTASSRPHPGDPVHVRLNLPLNQIQSVGLRGGISGTNSRHGVHWPSAGQQESNQFSSITKQTTTSEKKHYQVV